MKPDITVDKAPTDGTTVVWIDTPDLPEDDKGPVIRVYLNDEVIFENPPYPGEEARVK